MPNNYDAESLDIAKRHGHVKITCTLKDDKHGYEEIKLSEDMNLCSVDEDKEIKKDIFVSMYT